MVVRLGDGAIVCGMGLSCRAALSLLASCVVAWVSAVGLAVADWRYDAYDTDGLRWHVLTLTDSGYQLAFFCHGPGDTIKLELQSPEPIYLPTAVEGGGPGSEGQARRLAGQAVIAGPAEVAFKVDGLSRYDVSFYFVEFYRLLARDDRAHSLADFMDHVASAQTMTLAVSNGDANGVGGAADVATFSLAPAASAFARLNSVCGN